MFSRGGSNGHAMYVCRAAETMFYIAKWALALCLIFMILVSLEKVKKYSQRLKLTLFEIFSTLRVPFGHPPFEIFFKQR